MSTSFNFNERELRKRVEQAAISDFKKRVQPALDTLPSQCAGRPLSEVKRRLDQTWQRHADGRLTDRQLSECAKILVDGRRIELK